MKQTFFVLTLLLGISAGAHAQTAARLNSSLVEDSTGDRLLAERAISVLKKLDQDVIVYRSLGEFEEGGKLARVSIETFKTDLNEAGAEVNAITARVQDSRLQTEIRNVFASFRDGAFWWQKVYQPRVINVSSLTSDRTQTSTDAFLQANTPYTVAIYWRQASRYLQRAERRAASLSQ